MVQELTIEDLAKLSNLSLRTLRYYIQEGLLPGPNTAGKYASYSQEHLDYLSMIQRLKRLHLPLKEIRHLLSNMTPEDMSRILNYQDQIHLSVQDAVDSYNILSENEEPSSALDYIRNLEQRQTRLRSVTGSPSIPAAPQMSQPAREDDRVKQHAKLNLTERESWTRIIINEGIELNIKEKEALKYRREIGELINFAKKIFSQKNIGGS